MTVTLSFGATFKAFRLEQNLSLSQAAGDIVGKSFLSKFERGQSAISAEKLWALLQRMNITVSEFQYRALGYNRTTSEAFFAQLREAVANNRQNIAAVDKLISQTEIRFTQTRLPTDRVNAIAARAIKYTILNGQKLPQDQIDYVADYLFRAEEWRSYHLQVISYMLIYLADATRRQIAQTLITQASKFQAIAGNREQATEILLNILALMIRDRHFQEVTEMLGLLAKNSGIQASLTSSIAFYALKSAYWFVSGEEARGRSELQWVFQTLHHLGEDEYAQALSHQWYQLTRQRIDYSPDMFDQD